MRKYPAYDVPKDKPRCPWAKVFNDEVLDYEIADYYIFNQLDVYTVKSEFSDSISEREKKAAELVIDSLLSVSFEHLHSTIRSSEPELISPETTPMFYNLDDAIITLVSFLRLQNLTYKEIGMLCPRCVKKTDTFTAKYGGCQAHLLACLDLANINAPAPYKVELSPMGWAFSNLSLLERTIVVKKLILKIPVIRNLLRYPKVTDETITAELSSAFNELSTARWFNSIKKLFNEFIEMVE